VNNYFRFAVAAMFACAGMARAADLTVEVAGLKDARGTVMVAVYDRADNFLKQPVRTAAADAQTAPVRLVIAGLPAGDYALSVFNDANGNGKLDKNPVGMPIEPYGFGNDAAGSYGPPGYQASLVHLPAAGATTTIHLR
jgi:uncharacterized protein (DUF2141 family)